MNHDLLMREERMRGLRNRPLLVPRPLLRGEALNTRASHAAWERALDERRAKLFPAAVVLLVPAIAGVAWLFSLLGWIR